MTQIPIYKAKKIDSDEWVEGFLFHSYVKAWNSHEYTIIEKGKGNMLRNRIDSSTLTISFNSGKSWIKLSDIEMVECTDFKIQFNDMKYRSQGITQPPNGSIFTIITDKGR